MNITHISYSTLLSATKLNDGKSSVQLQNLAVMLPILISLTASSSARTEEKNQTKINNHNTKLNNSFFINQKFKNLQEKYLKI